MELRCSLPSHPAGPAGATYRKSHLSGATSIEHYFQTIDPIHNLDCVLSCRLPANFHCAFYLCSRSCSRERTCWNVDPRHARRHSIGISGRGGSFPDKGIRPIYSKANFAMAQTERVANESCRKGFVCGSDPNASRGVAAANWPSRFASQLQSLNDPICRSTDRRRPPMGCYERIMQDLFYSVAGL